MSYSAALGALVLFYVACRDLLTPFKALPKFILVKSVVFLTYWQVSNTFLPWWITVPKEIETGDCFYHCLFYVYLISIDTLLHTERQPLPANIRLLLGIWDAGYVAD
jgi:hypothetical protein